MAPNCKFMDKDPNDSKDNKDLAHPKLPRSVHRP
jgi:hypothetical protein